MTKWKTEKQLGSFWVFSTAAKSARWKSQCEPQEQEPRKLSGVEDLNVQVIRRFFVGCNEK